MKSALAGVGSLTWTVAVISAVCIGVGSAAQMVPFVPASTPVVSAPAQRAAPAAIVRLADGPGTGLMTIQMSSPFSDVRVSEIGDRIGADVVASFPAFGTYVLKRPEISVDVTGADTASISFPPIASWKQVRSYLSDNGLTLVPGRYHRDVGGWLINVMLPKIDAQPVDPYAGLWSVQLPGHPGLDRVTAWATSKGFTVESFDPSTGKALLRGHAVERPRLTAAQIADLLRTLIPAQSTPVLPTLAPATGLTVEAGAAKLAWSPAQGASAYAVWRSASVTGPWTLVGRVSNAVRPLAFTDSTVPTGTSFYRVTSLRSCPTGLGRDCDTQSPMTMDEAESSGVVLTTVAAPAVTSTGTTTTDTTAPPPTTTGTTTTGTGTTTTTQPPTTPPTSTDTTATGTGTTTTTPPTAPPPTTTPPPDTITSPAPDVAATDGHVTVSWQAITGASGYKVYRTQAGGPAVLIATTTELQIVDVGGTAGESYTYGVLPIVPASPPVQQVQSIALTWAPVTGTPVVLDMQPAEGSVSGTLALSASVRTGNGTGSVTWSVAGPEGSVTIGTAPAEPSASDPLTWTAAMKWDSASVADGSYQLHTAVSDGSGHVTSFDTSIRIHNSAPAAPTSLGAAPLQAGVALTWQQPAAADGAVYEVNRDGTPVAELPAGTLSWVDWNATAGEHTYTVELEDQYGHGSHEATATVSATSVGDTDIAPALVIRLPNGHSIGTDGAVVGRVLLVAESAARAGVTFEFAADGAAGWTPVTAPVMCSPGCVADWRIASLSAGHYRVRAVSSHGSVGEGVGFTIVAAPPPETAAPLAAAPLTFYWAPSSTLATVSGLRAVAGVGAVTLLWSPVADSTGYQVERSATSDGTYAVIARVGNTIYRDTSTTGGQSYYRVRALSGNGLGAPSAAVSAILVPAASAQSGGVFVAAAAPATLALGATSQAATVGSHLVVSASGTASANVAGVNVQVQQASAWRTIATLPVASSSGSWTAAGTALTAQLTEGSYAVRAVAMSPDGSVVATTEQSTITVDHSSPLVAGLVASARSNGLELSWTPAASDVTYSVYRVDAAGSALTLAATGLSGTTFIDAGLVPGTSNGYVVAAVDGFGNEGPLSNPAWATLPSSSIPQLSVLTPAAAEQPGEASILLAAAAQAAAGVASVQFFYAPSGGGNWININPVRPGAPAPAGGNGVITIAGATAWTTTLRTTGLAAGRYDLRVVVTDSAGASAQTMDTFFVGAAGARGPPAPGFQLSASATTAGAQLAWTGGAGSEYQVRRAVGANGTFSSLATLAGTTFDDANLIVGLTYAYQVVELDPSVMVTNTRTISATLTPPTVVTSSGGSAASGDGAATLTFAPGTVAGGLAVSVANKPAAVPAGIVALSGVFDLSAIDTATGELVTTFAGGMPTLTIHYNPNGLTPSSIYYLAPDGTAVAIPSTVDRAAHTISAQLPHFSSYMAADAVTVSPAASPSPVDAPGSNDPPGPVPQPNPPRTADRPLGGFS